MELPPNITRLLNFGFCAFAENQEVVVDAFIRWQNPILEPLGASLAVSSTECGEGEVLPLLFPLVTPTPTRYAFVQWTSGWVLMISNSLIGADSGQVSQMSLRCQCVGIKALSRNDTMARNGPCDSYGATIFESFRSGDAARSVFCANDGGKWVFGQSGLPYACEDLAAYSRKSVKTRFGAIALAELLTALGILPDCSECPSNVKRPTILVSRVGELPHGYREHARAP